MQSDRRDDRLRDSLESELRRPAAVDHTHVPRMNPDPSTPVLDAWSRCLTRLESEFPVEEVRTWLNMVQPHAENDSLVLYSPNVYVTDHIEAHFLPRIRELMTQFSGASSVRIANGTAPREVAEKPSAAQHEGAGSRPPAFHGNLNIQYFFDNFVEGRSNQLARAAAWQAAMSPGDRAHNPLLLYGSTGLGKTHLMVAAGNEIVKRNPKARVLYLRARDFLEGFTKALYDQANTGGTEAFRRQFQGLDALLIDDIQFFAGKDRTQEEFFHTFNTLFDGRQQIILTCDRYPREVEGLEPRLTSRLGWGLPVAIDSPDFETRAQIAHAKAREKGLNLPNDVAELLAKKLRSSIRDLEGAINTLAAQSHFFGKPITLEFAQDTLRGLLRDQAISIQQIQKAVGDYYGLQIKDLLGPKRTRSLARPRQVAMRLAKELTDSSLPEIGEQFGGRDHTTVMHACKQIDKLMDTDGKLHEDWEKLVRKLSE